MIVIDYIEVKQPIGTFYMCSVPASILVNIVESRAYSSSESGVQRDLSPERTKAIASYCSDPDAVFPTPIVVSVDKSALVDINETTRKIIIKDETQKIGEVIDGQHRLWGIQKSDYASRFNLPVVLMFDLTVEEKAYVFSTINSNQKKVDTSLIYELFDVSNVRSPQRTVHQLARVMNLNEDSPFRNRLKMLGKKEKDQKFAVLSQGTFAKSILMLISKNEKEDNLKSRRNEPLNPISGYVFRDLFIADKDDMIAKILMNCFNALKHVFYDEWENPLNSILWKTTGFRAVVYSLKSITNKGRREKDLTKEFFVKCFNAFKKKLEDNALTLTSESFPGGGEQSQKKLAALIINSVAEIDVQDYYHHLTRNVDYLMFLDNLGDLDVFDIYDLATAIQTGRTEYSRFTVKNLNNDRIEIVHPFTDSSVELSRGSAQEFLHYIEDKYMDGLDAESWYGYIQANLKND